MLKILKINPTLLSPKMTCQLTKRNKKFKSSFTEKTYRNISNNNAEVALQVNYIWLTITIDQVTSIITGTRSTIETTEVKVSQLSYS